MSAGYLRLRVEEGPPQPDALAALAFTAPPQVQTARPDSAEAALRRELEQVKRDRVYWEAECKRVIREREGLKTAIASDNAAAYFRAEWRKANTALNAERLRRDRLQRELDQARDACAAFTESRDRLQRVLDGLKRTLWDLWSGLDETAALRRPLWSLWSTL